VTRLLLIFSLLLSLGMGCHKADSETQLRFVYWGDLKEVSIIDTLVRDFEKANPGLHIKNERVSAAGPAYMERLQTQFAAGVGPDVWLVSSYYVDAFKEFGVIGDLSAEAQKSPVLKGLKDFYPEIVKEFKFGGGLYAIPRDIAPVCAIYYNKQAFDEAGLPYPKDNWTWPEPFTRIAQKLTKRDKDGKVLRWGYVDDWEMADAFVYGAGGKLTDNAEHPTRGALDSPQAIAGYQYRADLINKYKAMPGDGNMVNMGGMGTSELFTSGKAAMFYSGAWKIPSFREIKDFKWDVAMFPAHEKTGKRGFQGGGSGYGLNSKLSPAKRGNAWKFIEFLTSPESQAAMAASGLLQPANRRIAESKAFLDGMPANKAVFLRAVPYVYERPKTTRWNEYMRSGIYQSLDDVWAGKVSAEAALKKSVPVANEKVFGIR
jgi:multiple sugar transport system substrate-binding protein